MFFCLFSSYLPLFRHDILIIWNFNNSNIIQINAINYYFNTGTFKNTIYQFIYLLFITSLFTIYITTKLNLQLYDTVMVPYVFCNDQMGLLCLLKISWLIQVFPWQRNILLLFLRLLLFLFRNQEIAYYQSQGHVLGKTLSIVLWTREQLIF